MIDLTEVLLAMPSKSYLSYLCDQGYASSKMGGYLVKKPFKVGNLELEYKQCISLYKVKEELEEVMNEKLEEEIRQLMKSLSEKQTWSNVELEQLEFKIGVYLTERAEVDNLVFGRPIC